MSQRTDLGRIPSRERCAAACKDSVWNKEVIADWRRAGDEPADVVAAALDESDGLTNISDLLSVVQTKAKEVEGPDNVYALFLRSVATVPSLADQALIERGQRIHCVHLPFMGLSLLSGSLIGGSVFRNQAVVTYLAGNLSSDPVRRVRETGLLLAALALPGSLLHAGSAAHDSLTRVRLLHAALRRWLPRSGRLEQHKQLVPPHVYVEGELPLNQCDLAITLGIFCYQNLRSLRRMGIILADSDVKAYTAMWQYAGHVLGIAAPLLPGSLEAQEQFMLAAYHHQADPDSIPGAPLRAFIGAFAAHFANQVPLGLLPRVAAQDALEQLTVYLNGLQWVTGMGLSDKGAMHWAVLLTRMVGFGLGTVVARGLAPLGMESLLFYANSRALQKQLRRRGTPTGHAAGSGVPISRL